MSRNRAEPTAHLLDEQRSRLPEDYLNEKGGQQTRAERNFAELAGPRIPHRSCLI
jgi:hypothetical protein